MFNEHPSRESAPGVQEGQGGNGKPFFLGKAVQCGPGKRIPKGNLSPRTDRCVGKSQMELYELFLYLHNEQQRRRREHRAKSTQGGKTTQNLIISSPVTCTLPQTADPERWAFFKNSMG